MRHEWSEQAPRLPASPAVTDGQADCPARETNRATRLGREHTVDVQRGLLNAKSSTTYVTTSASLGESLVYCIASLVRSIGLTSRRTSQARLLILEARGAHCPPKSADKISSVGAGNFHVDFCLFLMHANERSTAQSQGEQISQKIRIGKTVCEECVSSLPAIIVGGGQTICSTLIDEFVRRKDPVATRQSSLLMNGVTVHVFSGTQAVCKEALSRCEVVLAAEYRPRCST